VMIIKWRRERDSNPR